MKSVKISKEKLLEKLKENRTKHLEQYEKALEGWKDQVVDTLQKALGDARADRDFIIYFDLPKPEVHSDEYDAVIDQVEWNEEEQIELALREFNKFIRDDWQWKKDFLDNTAMYSKMG